MKGFILTLSCMVIFASLQSQTITKILLIGPNGPTKEIKEAKSFIAVKKYPNGSVELLDYKMRGPLKSTKTYVDAGLRELDGAYREYADDGSIKLSGWYTVNQKDNDWLYFNDTGKVILKEKYSAGVLIETVNPDTIEKNLETQENAASGEREAAFIGKKNAWNNYLVNTINPDIGSRSVAGGKVKVGFAIETSGRPSEVHIKKSVEYVLDEESLRVIYFMPSWSPAVQNGIQVKAYRVQPFNFVKE